MISEGKLNEIKELYPIGTKVKLTKDMDDKYPILAGTIGTIDYIDGEGQLHMIWENGRTLALIPEIDQFETIDDIDKDNQMLDEVER